MIEEAVIDTWHMVPPRRRRTTHTLLPPHASSLPTVSTGGKPSTLSMSTASTLSSSSSSSTTVPSTVLFPCRKRNKQGYIMCSTGPQKRAGRHTFATCHKSIHVANFASTSSSELADFFCNTWQFATRSILS